MAIAADITAPQAQVFSIVTGTAADIRAPQLSALAIYNVPALNVKAAFADLQITYSAAAPVFAAQAQVLAVVRGRSANPKLRVFTFTLDEHDFYVVRLGDSASLIYDTYSQQWPEWSSKDLPFWRANCGCNWLGAQRLATQHGSNIVLGDDTFGLLWFLDPTQAYDDAPDPSSLIQQEDFPRTVMGQVTARGREFIPCYSLFVDGDNYGLSGVSFTPSVTIAISDNQGIDFTDLDTIDVILDPADANEGYIWTSLGQISSPGRLFRITDNGVFARIDSLEMNDG